MYVTKQEEKEKGMASNFQVTKQIMVTDGVRHTITFEEILGG